MPQVCLLNMTQSHAGHQRQSMTAIATATAAPPTNRHTVCQKKIFAHKENLKNQKINQAIIKF